MTIMLIQMELVVEEQSKQQLVKQQAEADGQACKVVMMMMIVMMMMMMNIDDYVDSDGIGSRGAEHTAAGQATNRQRGKMIMMMVIMLL